MEFPKFATPSICGLYKQMNPQPKTIPTRDPAYLAWIRKQPCVICGGGPCHAAHCSGLDAAGARKAGDYYTVPLCFDCHMLGEHDHGIRTTWNERSIYYFQDKQSLRDFLRGLCGRLWELYERQKG